MLKVRNRGSEWFHMALRRPRWWDLQLGPATVLAIAGLACQTAPSVETDQLEGVRFSGYRSFALTPGWSGTDDPAFGPSARQAAEEALVDALRSRDRSRVEAEKADLLVAVRVSVQPRPVGGIGVALERSEVVSRGTDLSTPVGNVPLTRSHQVSRPATVVETEPVETSRCVVVVDAFDASSRKHVWRGTSRCRWQPPHRVDLDEIRERVRAIAAELPVD